MYNKENTKEAMEILGRITAELERKHFSQAELISYLELPRGTYSAWKAQRSRNFCEHLGEIALFLDVSAQYLVTGEIADNYIENSKEQELLDCYRRLSEDKQAAVLQNAKWLAE